MERISDVQKLIKDFDKKRGWDTFYPKDLLLNLSEEIGEMWQVIAWEKEDKQKILASMHKEQLQNDIGQILFIVLKLANQLDLDADKGLRYTFEEFEKRFPIDKVKNKTANKDFGVDLK